MLTSLNDIESIVFDLDGTLYVCPEIADEIRSATETLVAETRGVSLKKARKLLCNARSRLTEVLEEEPTLTRTCIELGIEVPELHRNMQEQVHPERYLESDPILYALLDSLRTSYGLYLYTNNNFSLTRKILSLLGVEDLFVRQYTIEFTWRPKPDAESFHRVMEDIGGPPESFLFVGDRHQVDLKTAEAIGIPTLLIDEPEDLVQIHRVLGLIP